MKIDKPLAVIRAEGTGGNVRTQRLVEFAAARFDPDAGETFRSWRFNPDVPLAPEVESRLRVCAGSLATLPDFAAHAREIAGFLAPCDLCGYDLVRQDIPLLCGELHRAGVKDFAPVSRRILDLQRIFHRHEPRDLSAAVRTYCKDGHDDAHSALADVRATLDVLLAMFQRHPELPRDMEALDRAYGGRELAGLARRAAFSGPSIDLGGLLGLSGPTAPETREPPAPGEVFPIHLTRPLLVFDIEGTGLDVRTERIIELAATRVDPDGTRVSRRWLFHPTIPIPAESTAIHGFTDADVADQPPFADCALEISGFFDPCDLCGFNLSYYDIPLLREEFSRAGMDFSVDDRRILDVQRIFHSYEPRDLPAAVRFFCPPGHPPSDGAEEGVRAIVAVLAGQCARYAGLPRSFAGLAAEYDRRDPRNADLAGRLRWADGEIVVNFGKKRGERLRDLVEQDPGFLKWILKSDFPFDTRALVENALDGSFPPPPPELGET
ncbi:MAG: exonuclease domain-containing protein [Kiritimatiellia bacterium]